MNIFIATSNRNDRPLVTRSASGGTFALQALLDEAVQQRAAVVAEGEPLVGVHHEPVRHVDVEALAAAHAHAALLLHNTTRQSPHLLATPPPPGAPYLLLHAGALGHDGRVAALVDDARAHCRRTSPLMARPAFATRRAN